MKIFLITNELKNQWYVIATNIEEAIEMYKNTIRTEFNKILSIEYISQDVIMKEEE